MGPPLAGWEQLRTAHVMLDAMGVAVFAERARRELLASGETARKRTAQAAVEASQALTAQEAQVARLARDGLSNPGIGARLFISSHTVQYHLSVGQPGAPRRSPRPARPPGAGRRTPAPVPTPGPVTTRRPPRRPAVVPR